MLLVIPPAVTRTSATPRPAGLGAGQLGVLLQLTLPAATVPNFTAVAPAVVLKPDPVIVAVVPPEYGPPVGLRPETLRQGPREICPLLALVASTTPVGSANSMAVTVSAAV